MFKWKGFTLIELLVVIAIIAILTTIGMSIYSGAQKSVRDARRKADVGAIASAYEGKYNPIKNKYSALTTADFVNGNVPKPPENPSSYYDGFNSTQYFDPVKNNQGSSWIVCARLEDHLANTPCTGSSPTCYCRDSAQGSSPSSIASADLRTINPVSGTPILLGVSASLSDWTSIKTVTISNTSGGALSNYQIKMTVNFVEGMKTDFGDMRFVDSAGTNELSYFIEGYTPSTSADVWVKVPSVPTGSSTIKLVYGNSSATTTSNGNNTFDLYDDFNGASLDANKWDLPVSAGSIAFNSGAVTLSNNGLTYAGEIIKSKTTFSNPLMVEAKVNGTLGYGSFILLSNTSGWNGYMMFYYEAGGSDSYHSLSSTVTPGWCGKDFWTKWESYKYEPTKPNIVGIWTHIWLGSSSYRNIWPHGLILNLSNTKYTLSNFNVSLGVVCSKSGSDNIVVDWLRVRKYVSVEPTVTL